MIALVLSPVLHNTPKAQLLAVSVTSEPAQIVEVVLAIIVGFVISEATFTVTLALASVAHGTSVQTAV